MSSAVESYRDETRASGSRVKTQAGSSRYILCCQFERSRERHVYVSTALDLTENLTLFYTNTMKKEKKVVFIVNPNAGAKKKINIPQLINSHFSKDIPSEILTWDVKNDFSKISERIFAGNFTIAVAVGGDGTVNEVAKTVNHSEIALGIIPFGSGNGLARSLGIPMNALAAIKRLENGSVRTIDSGLINGKPFFCTSGMGFDAHIGSLFATSTTRGLWTYAKITTKELFGYKPLEYKITHSGGTFTRKAFLITFANAGQYGNDFYISPQASTTDGLLHIVVL